MSNIWKPQSAEHVAETDWMRGYPLPSGGAQGIQLRISNNQSFSKSQTFISKETCPYKKESFLI
jgi:hypothetical protein